MPIDSDYQQVIAPVLRALEHPANPSRPRKGHRRLGDEMADVVAAGIQARTIRQQTDPDGNPLAPLKSRTLARKRRLGFPSTIGVETGEMLDFEQIRGQVAMDETDLAMTYGLDQEMRDRASFMIEGDPSRNRPARDFYGLDGNIAKELDVLVDETISDRIRDLGGD